MNDKNDQNLDPTFVAGIVLVVSVWIYLLGDGQFQRLSFVTFIPLSFSSIFFLGFLVYISNRANLFISWSISLIFVSLSVWLVYLKPGAFLRLAIVALVLIVVSIVVITVLNELGQRSLRRDIEQQLESDRMASLKKIPDPPYSLYLRAFETTDRLTVRASTINRGKMGDVHDGGPAADTDFETVLAQALKGRCPLHALGLPGEMIGATRIETEESNWRQHFYELATKAAIIFIVPANNEGTYFEIQQVFLNENMRPKTVFIMPPSPKRLPVGKLYPSNAGGQSEKKQPATVIDHSTMWESAKEKLVEIEIQLPDYSDGGMFFAINEDGRVEREKMLEIYDRTVSENEIREAIQEITDYKLKKISHNRR